ncbi:hypothetical protein ACFLSW_03760 [Candidatus Bipolaricaulota bacterium]
MAVLAEGISVIVRRDAIAKKFIGKWIGFVASAPNSTFCHDKEIACVGFMTTQDVREFVESLERQGLTFVRQRTAVDLAVVGQMTGPTTKCDWLEFVRFAHGDSGGKLSACWCFDGERRWGRGIHFRGNPIKLDGTSEYVMPLDIAVPPGWKFEGSLSERGIFIPLDKVKGRMEFLHTDGNVDVYRDRMTGEKRYVGWADLTP